ncbi:hypothetical protein ACFXKW_00700 [Streptomyces sp. NPDC059193]|uniref:hypothetical protein n=1 Tax=Streptomyces sp. NPDC059193 TaxID=3346763 RepID=UPI0036902FB0
MSEEPTPDRAARSKRMPPAYFRIQGTSLVKDLLAGADAVAGRSFLGSGGQASGPVPAAVPSSVPVPAAASAAPARPAEAADAPAAGTVAAPSVVVPASPVVVPASPAAVPLGPLAPGDSALGAPVDRPTGPWAHGAVHVSYADAKLRSSQWRAHGFRIAPDVLARLKTRVNRDRRTTGNPHLAIGHYVDAALRHMPGDVGALIAMAEEFGTGQLWDQERTQPSTYRIGRRAYALASGMKMQLQEADFGRRGTQVVSAGIEIFLDALETEGPLQRPVKKG